jgi:hypothetical protein
LGAHSNIDRNPFDVSRPDVARSDEVLQFIEERRQKAAAQIAKMRESQ